MSSLPLKLPWPMAETRWASELEPVLRLPPNQGTILKGVTLVTGTNVVNHKLSRKLEGWIPTRVRGSATLYDTQDTNQTPELTLVLVSSANVTVDLWVF